MRPCQFTGFAKRGSIVPVFCTVYNKFKLDMCKIQYLY